MASNNPPGTAIKQIAASYLHALQTQRAQTGTTAELSYREFLGAFLRDSSRALGSAAQFTHEAKQIAVGRPDYEVRQGQRIIGYVEAEALETPLASLKGHAKEQNARFRQNLHNFLLTNHWQFQLFVDSALVASVSFPELPEPGRPLPHLSDSVLADLQTLLERFLDGTTPSALTAADVARQLAKRARLLRAAADALLAQPDSPLHPFWNAYKQTLYSDLSAEKFADVYAQTFTYGLFLAWLSTDQAPFDRPAAIATIPDAVPPIQALLEFGGTRRMPGELAWIVDGICQDLDAANRAGVMAPFAETGDPMVHFYETFLAAYDPAQRERVGVYYTPDAIVEFLVRAVDDLLRDTFGKPAGLADPSVLLLDPATGTATFLAHAYRRVHATLAARGDGGLWPDVAREHLARNFNGFELLPAAYTLAHIKLRQLLLDLGAPLPDDLRLPVYLTNTLEAGVRQSEALPFTGILAAEAEQAAHVKNDEPILVVLGNPPYSGHSANPSRDARGELTFIGNLIQDYFQVDGVNLGERNPKWLQDDYVKFLRFAQWRIAQTGHGIVAFITNHGYLDNPTFRGMRRSLMQTFDTLYLYDLHGNAKKKERAPDGGEDKNVFDIQQGVALCVLVKRPAPTEGPPAAEEGPPAPNNGGARGESPALSGSPLLGRGGLSSGSPLLGRGGLSSGSPLLGRGGLSSGSPLLGRGGLSSGSPLLGRGGHIFHADLYGPRAAKYAALRAASLDSVAWTELTPTAPFYLFRPQDQDVREEYEQGWSVTEIFPINNIGMQTHRDYFVTDLDEKTLRQRITDFRDTKVTDGNFRETYGLGQWDIAKARARLRANEQWEIGFCRCLWRPFDIRPLYYEVALIDRPRRQITEPLLRPNLALLAMRQVALDDVYSHFLVADIPIIDRVFYSNKGAASVFPLYRYPTETEAAMGMEREANLNPAIVAELTALLGDTPTPEDIFHYIYGVFHAPTYRERYAQFLKGDFPRVPRPASKAAFDAVAALGAKLTALHLLEDPALDSTGIGYPIPGSHEVQKMKPDARYTPPNDTQPGRVRLNAAQYFDNIPPEAWTGRIGGYQPAAKWLDDRAGRRLNLDEITHYRRMIAALRETHALLPALDAAFADIPAPPPPDPLSF